MAVVQEQPDSVSSWARAWPCSAGHPPPGVRHYLGRVFAPWAAWSSTSPSTTRSAGPRCCGRAALEAALAQPFSWRWVFDVELLGRLLGGTAAWPPRRRGVPRGAADRVARNRRHQARPPLRHAGGGGPAPHRLVAAAGASGFTAGRTDGAPTGTVALGDRQLEQPDRLTGSRRCRPRRSAAASRPWTGSSTT